MLSINRFQLAAASAVVPRLVPAEDLLIANSIATVGGTLALLVGVFVGGKVADTIGEVSVLLIATMAWLAASLVAGRIRSDLAPMTLPESPELLRHAAKRIVVETWDGASTMIRTPHAIGPVGSITVDQIGQGIMLTLALVVFREQMGQGVASFSNVIGAGGVGVLLGIATAGFLEDRLPKERMVSLGFLVGGIVLIGGSFAPDGPVILLVAAVLGLTFAWKKVAVDTMTQESLPDGYRGRVFSVYDFFYNIARLIAAALAIVMIPALSPAATMVVVGAVFLAWTPVLPAIVSRRPQIDLRMDAGRRAHRAAVGRDARAGDGARGERRRLPAGARRRQRDRRASGGPPARLDRAAGARGVVGFRRHPADTSSRWDASGSSSQSRCSPRCRVRRWRARTCPPAAHDGRSWFPLRGTRTTRPTSARWAPRRATRTLGSAGGRTSPVATRPASTSRTTGAPSAAASISCSRRTR